MGTTTPLNVPLHSNFFVDAKGQEGAHIVDTTTYFDPSNKELNSKNKRFRAWKETNAAAVSNVCQFVC